MRRIRKHNTLEPLLATPDLCTSALGVGERVLGEGGYRAVSLGFLGFNFRFFGFSGCQLCSRFIFFTTFAPQ